MSHTKVDIDLLTLKANGDVQVFSCYSFFDLFVIRNLHTALQ